MSHDRSSGAQGEVGLRRNKNHLRPGRMTEVAVSFRFHRGKYETSCTSRLEMRFIRGFPLVLKANWLHTVRTARATRGLSLPPPSPIFMLFRKRANFAPRRQRSEVDRHPKVWLRQKGFRFPPRRPFRFPVCHTRQCGTELSFLHTAHPLHRLVSIERRHTVASHRGR
jgi:hypothetical protein